MLFIQNFRAEVSRDNGTPLSPRRRRVLHRQPVSMGNVVGHVGKGTVGIFAALLVQHSIRSFAIAHHDDIPGSNGEREDRPILVSPAAKSRQMLVIQWMAMSRETSDVFS